MNEKSRSHCLGAVLRTPYAVHCLGDVLSPGLCIHDRRSRGGRSDLRLKSLKPLTATLFKLTLNNNNNTVGLDIPVFAVALLNEPYMR